MYQRGAFSVYRREWCVDANVYREHLCEYNQTSHCTITRVSIIQTAHSTLPQFGKKMGCGVPP